MLNDSLELDRAFAALADPIRRGMLARLAEGPASVSELAAPLPISLPAVLQHLKALEASGLVASEKRGRVRTVRVRPETLGAGPGLESLYRPRAFEALVRAQALRDQRVRA